MEIIRNELNLSDQYNPSGRIDSFSAPALAEALAQSIKKGRYNIILNLEKVDYVSSAGLRVMIDVQKTCKQGMRGELILVNVPKRIFDTLELAGFVPLFKFFDDTAAAAAYF